MVNSGLLLFASRNTLYHLIIFKYHLSISIQFGIPYTRSSFRDPEHYCKITRTLANSRIAQPFSRCSRHNGGHRVIQGCRSLGNNEYGTCVRQSESSTANLIAQRTSTKEISNIMQFSTRLTRFCRLYKIATLSHSAPIRAPEKQLVSYTSC
ncbi:uncharacterized protein K441DRAFT_159687 [Cenococcum geophilum 1.58]|uniref:uncharacterized protein n=1 Tax=Cenococcum geophilum 1.58 TaxID=794803 RepID=UPI00358DE5B7|nr:hypothetical protein K441DRAFT_159687 [Cenococcum geophilum 1.58]